MSLKDMEFIVDVSRFYKKDPEAFEQAAETVKKTSGIPLVSAAVDRIKEIATKEISK